MKKLMMTMSLVLFALSAKASIETKTQCEDEGVVALLNYLEKNNENSDWHLFKDDKGHVVEIKDINSEQRFEIGSVIIRGDVESYNFTDFTIIPYVEVQVKPLKNGKVQCVIQDVGIAK